MKINKLSLVVIFLFVFSSTVLADNASQENLTDTELNITVTEESLTEDNETVTYEENSTEPIINETFPEENITEPLTNETLSEENNTAPVLEEPPSVIQTITKTTLQLATDALSIIKGGILKLTSILSTEDNEPIAYKQIDFYANEEAIGSKITDSEGIAALDWDTSAVVEGEYVLKATYVGDEDREGSQDTVDVIIQAQETNEEIEILNTSETTPEVITETTEALPSNVQKIEECQDIEYEEEEPIIGICTREINLNLCDDEPANTSCAPGKRTIEERCVKEIRKITKIKRKCNTKGFVVNDKIKLNTDTYTCSLNKEGDETIAICDSKYDGNGDGICHSGESCMKFVINGEEFNKYEKNSEDEFKQKDDSYFLQRASVEVLK